MFPQPLSVCRPSVSRDVGASSQRLEFAAQRAAAAYAPRSARSFLGDVYMFAKRWSDALAAYQSALSIPRASDTSDLGTGEILAKIAIAQVNLGDLAAADRSAESAAATLQTSMAAHPDQRQEHMITLRSTLLFHARIKQLRGDNEAAQTLELRAVELDGSK